MSQGREWTNPIRGVADVAETPDRLMLVAGYLRGMAGRVNEDDVDILHIAYQAVFAVAVEKRFRSPGPR